MPPATSGQYYGDKSNTKNDQEDVTIHPINQLSCNKDSANKIITSMDYTRITGSPNKNIV